MPSLSLLVLKTHQMEAVRRFYTALGVEFQQEKHDKGPIHFSGALGNTVLEIYPLPPDRTSDATTRLGVVVNDLSKVLETLVPNGLIGRKKPEQRESGLLVMLRDPDGRAVELSQTNEDVTP